VQARPPRRATRRRPTPAPARASPTLAAPTRAPRRRASGRRPRGGGPTPLPRPRTPPPRSRPALPRWRRRWRCRARRRGGRRCPPSGVGQKVDGRAARTLRRAVSARGRQPAGRPRGRRGVAVASGASAPTQPIADAARRRRRPSPLPSRAPSPARTLGRRARHIGARAPGRRYPPAASAPTRDPMARRGAPRAACGLAAPVMLALVVFVAAQPSGGNKSASPALVTSAAGLRAAMLAPDAGVIRLGVSNDSTVRELAWWEERGRAGAGLARPTASALLHPSLSARAPSSSSTPPTGPRRSSSSPAGR